MTSETLKPVYYLAAPFTRKAEMYEVRELFSAAELLVNSSWIDEPATSDTAVDDEYLQKSALKDLTDLGNCTVLVCFPGLGAGHHTEFGLAMAANMRLVVVGKRNNVFHYLPGVEHYEYVADFLAAEGVI